LLINGKSTIETGPKISQASDLKGECPDLTELQGRSLAGCPVI